MTRARLLFLAAALATIAIGLTVHRSAAIPPAARDVLGDALWATMMTWWIGALAPRASVVLRAAVALAISWTVELSQLYHAPAIDALRGTTVGRLALGNDFDARDLAAYAAGVVLAVLIETAVRRRRSGHWVWVTRDYTAQYPDPIVASAGATVVIDREDAEYPGWWWSTASDGRAGWVLAEFLDPAPVAGAQSRLSRDYSARELSVSRGERLTIEEERASWMLVRNEKGARGWVPISHVAPTAEVA